MTKDDAIFFLNGLRSANNCDETIDMAIAALCGSQPDPATGLMPCGCGEKAMLIGFQGFSCECMSCGTTTRNYEKEGQAKEAWNRAMGWRVEG